MEQHAMTGFTATFGCDAGRARSCPTARRGRAFTLIELLVVLAIIAVVAAVTLPSFQSVLESNEMTSAGELVIDQIDEARQKASALNITVQVRLIQRPNQIGTGYNAMQIWAPNAATGVSHPLSRVAFLPATVAISASAALSKLLGLVSTGQTMSLPNTASPAPYVSFAIRPSGIVEPVPTLTERSSLFLTLVPARSTTSGNVPANYFAVQLDPDTAVPLVYRP